MKLQVYSPRWDDMALVTAMAALAFEEHRRLSVEGEAVVQALVRIKPDLRDAGLSELSRYLRSMDDVQLVGLASNVKGVLHELHFVEMENSDGDEVIATLFSDPAHPDTDITLTNRQTGESWEVQLKATDSGSAVREWLAVHEDGQILVTHELAEAMGVKSSGFSNTELTAEVDQFFSAATTNDSLWNQVPSLSLVSITVIVSRLFIQLQQGQITQRQFYQLTARATGLRLARTMFVAAVLSVPGLNAAAGAVLVATTLESLRRYGEQHIRKWHHGTESQV